MHLRASKHSSIGGLQREVAELEHELAEERKLSAGNLPEREGLQARIHALKDRQAELSHELADAISGRDAALDALETLRAQVLGMQTVL